MDLLKKNQELQLNIEEMCGNGSGIAFYDGAFVIFVPNTAVGDRVLARVIKVTKKYAVAKVQSIIKASPYRVCDECECKDSCGGCDFRHISYEKECEYKEKSINDCFERIAFLPLRIEKFYPSNKTENYRNKAIYPIGTFKDGTLSCGFYAKNSHRIVPHSECKIGDGDFSKIKEDCIEFFNFEKLSAYCEETGKGLLRALYLRKSSLGSIILTVVINGSALGNPKLEERFCKIITEKHPNISGVMINENRKNTNVVLGNKWKTLYGSSKLEECVLGKKFYVSPASFFQVNHSGMETLYSVAAEYAGLQSGQRLVDLYCGTGTVGICMAKEDTQLYGVEISQAAVEDARENAKANGISASFHCFDVSKGISAKDLLAFSADVIVTDPPRKGIGEDGIREICGANATKIVYISCDSATLARDLAIFQKNGYIATNASAVDMFPRTKHVECVVRLCRNEHSSI